MQSLEKNTRRSLKTERTVKSVPNVSEYTEQNVICGRSNVREHNTYGYVKILKKNVKHDFIAYTKLGSGYYIDLCSISGIN